MYSSLNIVCADYLPSFDFLFNNKLGFLRAVLGSEQN